MDPFSGGVFQTAGNQRRVPWARCDVSVRPGRAAAMPDRSMAGHPTLDRATEVRPLLRQRHRRSRPRFGGPAGMRPWPNRQRHRVQGAEVPGSNPGGGTTRGRRPVGRGAPLEAAYTAGTPWPGSNPGPSAQRHGAAGVPGRRRRATGLVGLGRSRTPGSHPGGHRFESDTSHGTTERRKPRWSSGRTSGFHPEDDRFDSGTGYGTRRGLSPAAGAGAHRPMLV